MNAGFEAWVIQAQLSEREKAIARAAFVLGQMDRIDAAIAAMSGLPGAVRAAA